MSSTQIQIYVIMLENDNIFLYTTTHNAQPSVIYLECMVLHDFVKKHKPLQIIEVIPLNNTLDIDYNVKKYMQHFGIEHVRGGSYSNEILSPNTIQTLNAEINTDFYTIFKENEMINTINDIYCGRNSKFIWNEVNVNNEKRNIQNDLHKYKQIKDTLAKICSFPGNNTNKITREIINDIEWIKTRVLGLTNIQQTIIEKKADIYKYKTITSKLNEIYSMFSLVTADTFNDSSILLYEPKIYLNRTDIVFDKFVYHNAAYAYNEDIVNEALTLIDKLEYMCYTIINRKEEYEYELSHYLPEFEKQNRRMLRFLELKWEEIRNLNIR
jgi:hypothetical protein